VTSPLLTFIFSRPATTMLTCQPVPYAFDASGYGVNPACQYEMYVDSTGCVYPEMVRWAQCAPQFGGYLPVCLPHPPLPLPLPLSSPPPPPPRSLGAVPRNMAIPVVGAKSRPRPVDTTKRVLSSPIASFRPALWKTELCRMFEAGTCRRPAKACAFAHGVDDMRYVSLAERAELGMVPCEKTFKTVICWSWLLSGTCCYGSRCSFLHDDSMCARGGWLAVTKRGFTIQSSKMDRKGCPGDGRPTDLSDHEEACLDRLCDMLRDFHGVPVTRRLPVFEAILPSDDTETVASLSSSSCSPSSV
jgi:hypothetical protein